ncbi:alcohol dehydrogenase [Mycetocola sp. BIGb0189]|uniref:NADP-dependent oxidoreductase n=1 Tax=Mycetocola sp. BIGb0189 TaxID=2940604 RepID=UPI002167E7B2|nr:NADP-dependent oxidoreductase [Mycetocola sp. BIGb0189]MCS4276253.1 alcohol dehydrogenase [Mycetocola sp. BIGb0189]
MRAVVYARHGGPEVTALTEVATPTPGPSEVLIRTRAVGLNPIDAIQRAGTTRALGGYVFPQVAGNELAGTVAAVGSAVTHFAVGDRVLARVDKLRLGALGEWVAVDQGLVAPAPRTVPATVAAALPLAGLTAQQALGERFLNVQPGERILITGGAGGVGLLAIQLAKLRGAHVATTASEHGEALVRAMGADQVINYRTHRVSDQAEKYAAIFDMVGGSGLEDALEAIAPGGRVVSISGPVTPGSVDRDLGGIRRILVGTVLRGRSRSIRARAHQLGARYEFLFMSPDGPGLAQLAELVDAGNLRLTIDSVFPLEHYAEAFARLESRRAKGKVVIEFPEAD